MADLLKNLGGNSNSQSSAEQKSTSGASSGSGQDKYIRKGVDAIEQQLGMDQKNETQAEKDRDAKITSAISSQISGSKK